MLIRRFASLLFISAVPLAAQIVNNTVTVTASQSSTAAQPDEAVFSVTVGSSFDKSLDDGVAAVSSLGITAANLVGVTNVNAPAPQPGAVPVPSLEWIFQLVVPFSKLKDTTAALAALQKSVSQNNNGLTLSFALSSTLLSAQQAPTCNLANLVSQARAQAQDIAGAAGFKAGAVVGLTGATSSAASICSLTARFALGAMFGQPEPIITITATRTNSIQPDQVLIGLNVQSATTAGLDDITGALTGAEISGPNFTGVSTFLTTTGLQTQSQLVWSFTLTAPLAKLSATLTQIISAQQAISANSSGLILNFYVEGMQVSQQLQQSQSCSQAALLADAQAQAKAVATAAGVSAGSIVNMAEGSTGAIGGVYAGAAPTFGYVTNSLNSFSSSVFSSPQVTCSLTVQFQLM
jgi:uncharacterized protein YggE